MHKSPPKQHDGKGNVVNRLILKVDVHDLSDGEECSPSLALLRWCCSSPQTRPALQPQLPLQPHR